HYREQQRRVAAPLRGVGLPDVFEVAEVAALQAGEFGPVRVDAHAALVVLKGVGGHRREGVARLFQLGQHPGRAGAEGIFGPDFNNQQIGVAEKRATYLHGR
nr:hypothetical protein [Tanacetum cinerariifolium]